MLTQRCEAVRRGGGLEEAGDGQRWMFSMKHLNEMGEINSFSSHKVGGSHEKPFLSCRTVFSDKVSPRQTVRAPCLPLCYGVCAINGFERLASERSLHWLFINLHLFKTHLL